MKAIRVHETGGPEVLRMEDVPVPVVGPGELLIDVEAVGVNFIGSISATVCIRGRDLSSRDPKQPASSARSETA